MLVDEAKIYVRSGDGGAGVVAFRREKYVPMGGPAGGDGGKGGDVIVRVNPNHSSLLYFKRNSHFKAASGRSGGSSKKTGANAEDLYIDVPPGTIVRDVETGDLIGDLVMPGDQVIVARGGRGGRGNVRFKSSANKAPRVAEKGAPGEERWLKLEMKLIADVGIVGVPNAGKSTLLSVISNATPKIADYPFTTLEPNLGVVVYDHQDLVFADIPGLIEGAHQGVGLGHSFLRHIQRTRLLVHLLNGAAEDPLADFSQINSELALFDEQLALKPQIVVLNKIDIQDVAERWPAIQTKLAEHGVTALAISAATRQGLTPLIQKVFQIVSELPDKVTSMVVEQPKYELQDNEPIFTIYRRSDGAFVVKGARIERAAAMTYWDYEEAVLRFQKILEVLGITDALKAEGVTVGDTVFIGDYELEWTD